MSVSIKHHCVKCPNTELFLVRIFLYLNWIRRFTPYISVFSLNTGKYWPEITPYSNNFHAVHAHYNSENFISAEVRNSECSTLGRHELKVVLWSNYLKLKCAMRWLSILFFAVFMATEILKWVIQSFVLFRKKMTLLVFFVSYIAGNIFSTSSISRSKPWDYLVFLCNGHLKSILQLSISVSQSFKLNNRRV